MPDSLPGTSSRQSETIDREVRAQVVVLVTEHLLIHTCSDLHLEVEDSNTKAEIASFTTFHVLDFASASKSIHPGIDIFVEVQAFLYFRNPTTSRHVQHI